MPTTAEQYGVSFSYFFSFSVSVSFLKKRIGGDGRLVKWKEVELWLGEEARTACLGCLSIRSDAMSLHHQIRLDSVPCAG